MSIIVTKITAQNVLRQKHSDGDVTSVGGEG